MTYGRLTATDDAHHLHKLTLTMQHALAEDCIIPVCRDCHEFLEDKPEPDYVQRWRGDESFRREYWI